MANNYYCLVAGLPDILLEDKKVLYSSVTFRNILAEELSNKDLKLVEALYLPFDHKNIINQLFNQEKEFDPRGNFKTLDIQTLQNKRELDSYDGNMFPEYIVAFAKQIIYGEINVDNVKAEIFLFDSYLEYINKLSNSFLHEYVGFETNMANIFTALTGRKYNFNYEDELIGKGDIVEALIKSRSRDFGLANELDYLEPVMRIYEDDDILQRELKVDQLKWNYLDDITFFNYFTIERVMAFIYKLMMVERWMSLDEDEGKKLFRKLMNDLESGYEFPDEYKLSHGRKK